MSLYYEALEPEAGTVQAVYTDGFCKGRPAIVKNGNVYCLGFYCKDAPDIYYDIIRTHLNLSDPLDKDLEEVGLGAYRMYLNHSDRSVNHSGYDLLKQCSFDEIPPYGVVLEPTV